MNDFGAKVKAAEREVKAKARVGQNSKKVEAPYGFKKDGTPRKSPATPGRWKKGESGNPDNVWKPGESGNPGGKPQKTPITDQFRRLLLTEHPKHKGKTYAQVLAEKQLELACESGDMRAAQEIADRVEGKTVQIQQLQGPGGGAIPFTDVSPAENEKAIAALLNAAGGVKDGAD